MCGVRGRRADYLESYSAQSPIHITQKGTMLHFRIEMYIGMASDRKLLVLALATWKKGLDFEIRFGSILAQYIICTIFSLSLSTTLNYGTAVSSYWSPRLAE